MNTTRPAEPEDSAGRAASGLRGKHAGTRAGRRLA